MCASPETVDKDAAGFCLACRERIYRAKEEEAAARDRGRW